MFSEEELQALVSGGRQGLDLADMAAHCQYSGGYHADHPVIREFWAALGGLSPEQQAGFLRFVTSCPRPPLLGFRYLEPPLAIQVGGGGGRGRAWAGVGVGEMGECSSTRRPPASAVASGQRIACPSRAARLPAPLPARACPQMAGSMLDEHATERLPTAATCMNVLKLPPYRTAQQIREKLLYAIECGAGFQLS